MEASIAMSDRAERAIEVAATYDIEYIGCQSWVVMHPDEPERCYMVDMIARNCTCPDWHCTAQGLGIDCKHILAIAPLWEQLTGERFSRQEHSSLYEENRLPAVYVIPDDVDPFETV